MRENPMCNGCGRLDAIGTDPEIPCVVCGHPSATDQTSESAGQSKIAKAGSGSMPLVRRLTPMRRTTDG